MLADADGAAGSAYRDADKRFRLIRGCASEAAAAAAGHLIDVDHPGASVREVAHAHSSLPRAARIFALRDVDGFYVVRGALSEETQLHLARRALTAWAEPPNVSNLTAHHAESARSQLWESHRRGEPRGALLERLSWATLGYHYDWTARQYSDSARGEFPAEVAELAAEIAHACGAGQLRAEAAIVNYYNARSAMGGHLDDAEPDQRTPIVSISVGLSAVYLLGGPTKAVPPLALLLRSGDAVVQGGASRGCYHGVPLVIANTAPVEALRAAAGADDELQDAAEWLVTHRINVNARQVYADARDGDGGRPASRGYGITGRPDPA